MGPDPSYGKEDNVLSALSEHLLADEWKEVVPMVAVLARKQAAPLLRALVEDAVKSKSYTLSRVDEGSRIRIKPSSAARLTQAFIEEAEFPADILSDAYDVVATYAQGCQTSENWVGLARGPYGSDIAEHAWKLYYEGVLPEGFSMRNTSAVLLALAQPETFWSEEATAAVIVSRLRTGDVESRAKAAMLACGSFWNLRARSPLVDVEVHKALCDLSLEEGAAVSEAATWGLAFSRYLNREARRPAFPLPAVQVQQRLIKMLIADIKRRGHSVVRFALETFSDAKRGEFRVSLSKRDAATIRGEIARRRVRNISMHQLAPLVVAFHDQKNFDDEYIKNALQVASTGNIPIDEDVARPIFSYYNLSLPGDADDALA